MSQIKLMKPELANLIAAGEVIERPSSVIKELVENSIDANSKNIYVGVTDAGKGTILVKDDGSGMDREDAQSCFLRHASSKIKTEYDLNRIHTLGFRGEAIPSIASVSNVTLTTCYKDEGVGTKVESRPNSDLKVVDAPSRVGTIFEIKDLFFNTPARLKYLKSPQVETYSVIETMEHLALGFPNISFTTAVDGKEIFKTSGRGDLLETIQKIYGNTIAMSLFPIKKEEVGYSFTGYIAKPEINYSKRKYMLVFLNHRAIYTYKINKAIETAYKDYLPPLKYPFCIIDINIDPSLVDVNVHPTKKEVRISLEDDIARAISSEILKTLTYKKPIYYAAEDKKADSIFTSSAIDTSDTLDDIGVIKPTYNDVEPIKHDEVKFFQEPLPVEPSYQQATTYVSQKVEETPSINKPTQEYSSEDYYNTIFEDQSLSYKLPEMHPIGQVLQTYILCDSKDCFYIIDQHAAAERVNYEKTEALFASKKDRSIPLFPLIVDITPKEKNNLDQAHIELLESLGLCIEEFGLNQVKVVELPVFLNNTANEEVIKDCIHSCLNDEAVTLINLLHLTIANIACKKSIKANHVMPIQEVEGLLRDLAKCKNPANCPHGRPTIIKISRQDVEKLFRRSGF